METILLENDITILYVTAGSFPAGVQAAHDTLHKLIPFSNVRRYIAVSRPENGGSIVYRAGAEKLHPDEEKKYNLASLVVKNGTYAAIEVDDFRKNPQAIKYAFDTLLSLKNLAPEGYCVELYANNFERVTCMIRLMYDETR